MRAFFLGIGGPKQMDFKLHVSNVCIQVLKMCFH